MNATELALVLLASLVAGYALIALFWFLVSKRSKRKAQARRDQSNADVPIPEKHVIAPPSRPDEPAQQDDTRRPTSDDQLHLAETTLRAFIESMLRSEHGNDWLDHVGRSEDRTRKWEERREEERRRRSGAVVDERILSYADFYDLLEMLKSNWPLFKPCFGDQARTTVYLQRLNSLRDPGAHSRTLLPFERALIEGMTGEIRQQIALFQAKGSGGSEPEHFPSIVEVVDQFGTRLPQSSDSYMLERLTLRPGESVRFQGSAWDPDDRKITWRFTTGALREVHRVEGPEFEFNWRVREADISDISVVQLFIESDRPYHRHGSFDDTVKFYYRVLPPVD